MSNKNAITKLRELLEALDGDPDQNYSEPYVPRGAQFGQGGVEVFGTPPSASIPYSSEPGYSTTIIEPIFMAQYGMYQPQFGDITEMRQMGDGEGGVKNYLEIDPPLPPEELAGGIAPVLATMSSRGYSVRPKKYGVGFRLLGEAKRDSRLDEAAWIVNEISARFDYWPERELIRLVVNPLNFTAGTPMFTGADSQRLISTSHTYGVTDESYGVPAPTAATITFSNVTTGTGTGTTNRYTSESEVLADFHTARSVILSRKDAHGEPMIIEQPGGQWYAYCNTLEPTTSRYLHAAFTRDSQPSEDSLRDGHKFGVKVITTQMMNGVGGTITTSEYGDWLLAYRAPGARPPLFILDREPLRTAYQQKPLEDVEEWAWTIRKGVGYDGAQAIQLINAN